MGLDMYLERRTYVKNWDHTPENKRIKITLEGDTKGIDVKKVSYIIEEAGYWRKANAIHGWIVDNLADGKDECQPIYLTQEKMQQLYDICVQLLSSKDESMVEKLLPPRQGFFFGSYQIDDWYWQDLQQTVDILRPALDDLRLNGGYAEYYYQASW